MLSPRRGFLEMLALTAIIAVTMFACSLKIPFADSTDNSDDSNNNNQQGAGSGIPAPLISSTGFNLTNNDHIAVALFLDPTSPVGTQIYYTTDGTDPTTSISTLEYVLPLALTSNSATILLRAVAKNGTEFSTEVTGTYWFGDWEIVGDTYPKPSYPGRTAALFVDNNIPYIIHKGTAASTFEVEKLVAGVWTLYPAIGDCGSWAGGNAASYLFVENGIPYVACFDGVADGIRVQKYVSGAWTNIGIPIPYDPIDVFLYVEDGTPYISLIDSEGWGAHVYYYQGSTWEEIGSSPGAGSQMRLYVKNGVPYVSAADVVKKFNGTSWENIGSGTQTGRFDIYDDGSTDGKIYSVYADGNLQVKVYESGAWSNLPEIPDTTPANFTNITVKDDVPYISYTDGSGHARIKRFYAGTWSNVGTRSYHGNVNYAVDFFAAEDGTVYMYYSTSAPYFPYSVGLVESFGPGGSGTPAHVEDPLELFLP